jgi:plastocyanin
MKGERMKRMWKVLGTVLLVGALAGACGGDSGGDAEGGDAGGGGSVAVSAADFAFSPTSLTAAAGDTIEFSNDDDAKHSFTAEEAGIDEDADAGQSVSIDLGEAEAGTYDFICKYHPNMKGTLEITS